MAAMKAAVFDSGIGGLTVAKSLIFSSLFDEIIYYGDLARVPYGSKDPNTIIRYALEALEFFNNFDIDILIVACNTVSAYALDELISKANFPVVGVIEPGVLALENLQLEKSSRILISGTKATIASRSYENILGSRGFENIKSIATPLLVPIAEEGIFEGKIADAVFEHYFAGVEADAVILGCTHYPLLEKMFQKTFPKAKLVHSGDAIVEYLLKQNLARKTKTKTKVRFFASENVKFLREVANSWLKI